MVRPGATALAEGTVWHRRKTPVEHSFTQRVSYVWIDPDHPELLTDRHPLWSSERWAPVRFRRSDYGPPDSDESLAVTARMELAEVFGRRPSGPVRMLTQLRRLGWLFNPLTLYLVWDGTDLVGAVLEVTNTPWKERHRYPVPLEARSGRWNAVFDKEMHVSPFLEMDHRYVLTVEEVDERLNVSLDVVDREGSLVVETELEVCRVPPSRSALGRSLTQSLFATMRVSAGIHTQAARLLSKRVPFVSHPSRRETVHRLEHNRR